MGASSQDARCVLLFFGLMAGLSFLLASPEVHESVTNLPSQAFTVLHNSMAAHAPRLTQRIRHFGSEVSKVFSTDPKNKFWSKQKKNLSGYWESVHDGFCYGLMHAMEPSDYPPALFFSTPVAALFSLALKSYCLMDEYDFAGKYTDADSSPVSPTVALNEPEDRMLICWRGGDAHSQINCKSFVNLSSTAVSTVPSDILSNSETDSEDTHGVKFALSTLSSPSLWLQRVPFLQSIFGSKQTQWNAKDKVMLKDSTEEVPTVRFFNGRYHLLWAGTGNGALNVMSSSDGVDWSGKETFKTTVASSTTMTVFRGQLYVCWSQGGSGRVTVSILHPRPEGRNSVLQPVHTFQQSSQSTPFITSGHGPNGQEILLVVWRRNGDDRISLSHSIDGKTFSPVKIFWDTTPSRPILIQNPFNSHWALVWQGLNTHMNYMEIPLPEILELSEPAKSEISIPSDLGHWKKYILPEKTANGPVLEVMKDGILLCWTGTDRSGTLNFIKFQDPVWYRRWHRISIQYMNLLIRKFRQLFASKDMVLLSSLLNRLLDSSFNYDDDMSFGEGPIGRWRY